MMTSIYILKAYLLANVLLTMIGVSLPFLRRYLTNAKSQLTILLGLIVFALILATFVPLFSSSDIMPLKQQVWSGTTMKKFSSTLHVPVMTSSILDEKTTLNFWSLHLVVFAIFVSGFLLGLFNLLKDCWKLSRILGLTTTIKSINRTRLLASSDIQIPFSIWVPRQNLVVLPTSLICERQLFTIATAHELQHHRQGDTKIVYFLEFLRLLFWWNPVVHFLCSQIFKLQEFACDSALLGRQRVSSDAYCRCLLWVAQHSLQPLSALKCTSAMIEGNAAKFLTRRVTMILGKEHSSNQTKTAMAGCLAALLLAGVAFATNVQVQDRRVTMAMAEQLLAKAHQETGVPLLVNDRILVQLNRFLGTPDGRDYMRNSLQRMERFRTMIEAKIERKHLPPELLAIPVVESGYRNIAQDETPMHGAGIWMVIVSTAKRLGLQVEPPLDERMIPAKETDAALKYLGILHAEFKDWWLAILGYNAGKVRVRKAIEATGSTNAWTLIDQGFENDSDYLATVIATILIMKNPETLD